MDGLTKNRREQPSKIFYYDIYLAFVYYNHGFKNRIKGKTKFSSSSWFNLVFDRFWSVNGFFLDQISGQFSIQLVKPASPV